MEFMFLICRCKNSNKLSEKDCCLKLIARLNYTSNLHANALALEM